MESPKHPEDFFYSCMMSLPGCVFWKDKQGVYLGANPSYLKLMGLKTLKQLVGKTDEDFFGKYQTQVILGNIKQALKTGETAFFQQIFKQNKIPVAMTFAQSPLKNSRGKVLGVIGISISDEDMLKKFAELQNKTTQIINNIPGSVYWKDKKGAYLGCNNYVAKMAGLDHPAQLIGKTDNDFVWKKVAEDAIKNDRLVIRSKKEYEFREIGRLKNGTQVEFLTRKTPLINEKGQVTGVLGVSLDITKLSETIKRLEEAKNHAELVEQAKNDFIAKLVDYIPGSVYWKDKKGTYLGCNNYVAKMAGLQHPNQLIGKTDDQLVWKKFAEQFRKHDLLVIQSGKEYEFQEELILAGETKIEMLSRKAPLLNEKGKVIGVLGVSLDITKLNEITRHLKEEKKRAELASQAKNDFIANMSHDIRTPLIGMLKLAECIKNKTQDSELIHDVTDMLAASNALFKLVNDMVQAARLITQDVTIQNVQLTPYSVFSKLIDLYIPEAAQKGIELNFYYDPKIPKHLVGDPLQLQRILLNLLGNAIKFTHQGAVSMSAKMIKNKKDTVLLAVNVVDTGIGIPQDKISYIFEPFARLHGTYESTYPGLGLGLSAVKKYIEGMGGEICVQSEEGKGSTFLCILPFKKSLINGISLDTISAFPSPTKLKRKAISTNNEKPTPKMKTAASTTTPRSLTILLIEDNLLVQRLLKDQIEDIGHHVSTAKNAEQALNLLENNTFNFIFMDIGLPDMSGDKLAGKIRSLENNPNQNVPIVAQTAHLDAQKEALCFKSGMQAVIEKPITTEQIHDLLDSYVFQRELQSA